MVNLKDNFKSLFCFIFAIGWFLYTLIKYHRLEWLIPIVFICIGFYLYSQE